MKLLKIFGVIFGLMLVTALAVMLYITTLDPNDYKELITDKFRENTGRTLSIDGNITLTLYPWLGVEVNDVTIGNADGFGDQPFIQTEHALVRVKLMPLLRQQYEVDTVRLHGARINLAKNEAGVTNWADLVSGEPSDNAGLPLAAVILGGVDIRDTSLSWDDQSTGARYDITNLIMTTGELVYGQPVEINLTLDAASNKPDINADLQLSGTVNYEPDGSAYNLSPLQLQTTLTGPNVPGGSADVDLSAAISVNLDNDTLSITNLDFNALDTRVTGTVNATDIQSPSPSYQATLDIAGSDLSVLFKVAEIEPLASQIAGMADRSFDFSAAINADMQRGDLQVSGLDTNLLGANISGDISASNITSATPVLRGTLNGSGPDLPALMQVVGQLQGGNESALTQYGRQLARVPNRNFVIDTRFDADLATGNIDVPVLVFNALGINVDGELAATDMQRANGTVNGQLNMTADRLKEILVAIDHADLAEVMQSITLDAGISGSRNDLNINPVDLKLVLSGTRIPNSPVSLGLAANTRLNLEQESLNLDEFSLTGLGLNVSGNLNASQIFQSPAFNGVLDIPAFNLRRLMQQLNQELPETADNTVFENVSLSTSFDGSADHMNISKLAMLLDDSNINGTFSITEFDQPAIKFGINIDQINADRYLPPESATNQTGPITPETAAGAAAQLPVETLRALNANGELRIGQLVISNAKMSDLVLTLNAKDGVIDLSPVAANLYRGQYQGEVNLDATAERPVLMMKSSLSGVDIDALMMDFMGESSASGIGDVELAITASGADTAAFKRSLNGTGSIALDEGVLRGVDIASVLEQVEIMIESKRVAEINRGIQTAFDTFTGTLQITDGMVMSNDLQIAAPGFKVTGRGTVINLTDDTINYNLVASVDPASATRDEERYNIGNYSIPIACRGQVSAPRCIPDVGEIIKVAVSREVERRLGDVLQRAIGGGAPATQPSPAESGEAAAQQPPPESGDASGEQQQQPQPVNPEQELINRALRSIFN